MATDAQPYQVQHDPFPAKTRTAQAEVSGIPTSFSVVTFADKIVVSISQEGRLAHWLTVPPTPAAPAAPLEDDASLLPSPHLTPSQLLGSPPSQGLQVGSQLLATQIASAVLTRDGPEAAREVVLGLGFAKEVVKAGELDRDTFMGLLEGVLTCL